MSAKRKKKESAEVPLWSVHSSRLTQLSLAAAVLSAIAIGSLLLWPRKLEPAPYYVIVGLAIGISFIGPLCLFAAHRQVADFFAEVAKTSTQAGYAARLKEVSAKYTAAGNELAKERRAREAAEKSVASLYARETAVQAHEERIKAEAPERKRLDTQLTETTERIKLVSAERDRALKERDSALGERDDLEGKLNEAQRLGKEAEGLLKTSEARVAEIGAALNKATHAQKTGDASLLELQRRFDAANSTAISNAGTLREQLAEVRRKLAEAQNGNREASMRVRELAAERDAARDHLLTLRQELQRAQTGFQTSTAASNAELVRMRSETAQSSAKLSADAATLEAKCSALTSENSRLQAQAAMAAVLLPGESLALRLRILGSAGAKDGLTAILDSDSSVAASALSSMPLEETASHLKRFFALLGSGPEAAVKLRALLEISGSVISTARRFELLDAVPESLHGDLPEHLSMEALREAAGCYLADPERFGAWDKSAILEGALSDAPAEVAAALMAVSETIIPDFFLDKSPRTVMREMDRLLPPGTVSLTAAMLASQPECYAESFGDPRYMAAMVEYIPAGMRARLGTIYAADRARQEICFSGGQTIQGAVDLLDTLLAREGIRPQDPQDGRVMQKFADAYQAAWSDSNGRVKVTPRAKLSGDERKVLQQARKRLTGIITHIHPLVMRSFVSWQAEEAQRQAKAPSKARSRALDALLFWDVSLDGQKSAGGEIGETTDYTLSQLMAVYDLIDPVYNRTIDRPNPRPTKDDRIGNILFRYIALRGGNQGAKSGLDTVSVIRAKSFRDKVMDMVTT